MLAKSRAVLVGALALAAAVAWSFAAQKSPQQERREALTKAANAGNFKDAYDGLRKLALGPKDDPERVGDDLVLVASDQRLLRAAQAEGLVTFDPETQSQADLDALLMP